MSSVFTVESETGQNIIWVSVIEQRIEKYGDNDISDGYSLTPAANSVVTHKYCFSCSAAGNRAGGWGLWG